MKKHLVTVCEAVLFFIGQALLAGFLPLTNCENPAVWRLWAELTPFLCMAGISLLFWLMEKKKICVFSVSAPPTVPHKTLDIPRGI